MAGDVQHAASATHEPEVAVGIVSGRRITFALHAGYTAGGQDVSGEQEVTLSDGAILWNGAHYHELFFLPDARNSSFSLKNVTIGVNFHWERQETQTFLGKLHLLAEDGKIWAINELSVEDYLVSVISSEMSAASSLQLLKAHAVISRSWLLAQMRKRQQTFHNNQSLTPPCIEREDMRIRWYDREDHTLFDVCADDHCQRYQGITKATGLHVAEAVNQTKGQVLIWHGEICDARFSKCCGGVMEEFQYCWEDTPKPYLKARADTSTPHKYPDLTVERNAINWIRTSPGAFCNTHDAKVLSQVLNDYDRETPDFYRWQVEYTQEELATLIAEKLKIGVGKVLDLIPMERGTSGRISKLQIVGSEKTFIIGKELEIRRSLSKTHLYSSAFVVDRRDIDADGIPARFRLIGAGWGHGVGLCQIGAAMMGEQGYAYDEILTHYYPGAEIKEIYS